MQVCHVYKIQIRTDSVVGGVVICADEPTFKKLSKHISTVCCFCAHPDSRLYLSSAHENSL